MDLQERIIRIAMKLLKGYAIIALLEVAALGILALWEMLQAKQAKEKELDELTRLGS